MLCDNGERMRFNIQSKHLMKNVTALTLTKTGRCTRQCNILTESNPVLVWSLLYNAYINTMSRTLEYMTNLLTMKYHYPEYCEGIENTNAQTKATTKATRLRNSLNESL